MWHNRIDCWLKRLTWPIFALCIFYIFCMCYLLLINAKLSQSSKERSRESVRVWGSEEESPKLGQWAIESVNELKSKWKSAKWCKQTSSMWRALIGSIKHEERRERGSKKLIKRRHYLISSSFFRMWLINLKKWKRTTKAGRRKEVACTQTQGPRAG